LPPGRDLRDEPAAWKRREKTTIDERLALPADDKADHRCLPRKGSLGGTGFRGGVGGGAGLSVCSAGASAAASSSASSGVVSQEHIRRVV
jgi:hypothetical protein